MLHSTNGDHLNVDPWFITEAFSMPQRPRVHLREAPRFSPLSPYSKDACSKGSRAQSAVSATAAFSAYKPTMARNIDSETGTAPQKQGCIAAAAAGSWDCTTSQTHVRYCGFTRADSSWHANQTRPHTNGSPLCSIRLFISLNRAFHSLSMKRLDIYLDGRIDFSVIHHFSCFLFARRKTVSSNFQDACMHGLRRCGFDSFV